MKKITSLTLGFAFGVVVASSLLVPGIVEKSTAAIQQARERERSFYLSRQQSYEWGTIRGTPLRVNLSSEPSITLAFASPYKNGARDAIRIHLNDQTTFQAYDVREGMAGFSNTDARVLRELSSESLVSVSYSKRDGRFYAHRISVTYR